METQQLEFVLAAMKADSFAQAARKCYTSRQNISHAVKATEREFGVVLFKRENKKLVLTEDGKIFSAKAQRVLDTVREMHQIAAHNGSQTFEALNVAVSTTLFSALPSGTAEMLLNWPGGVRFEEMDYEDCIGCASDESVDGGPGNKHEPRLSRMRFVSHRDDAGICMDRKKISACATADDSVGGAGRSAAATRVQGGFPISADVPRTPQQGDT